MNFVPSNDTFAPLSPHQRSWVGSSKKQRDELLDFIRHLAEDDKEGVMATKVMRSTQTACSFLCARYIGLCTNVLRGGKIFESLFSTGQLAFIVHGNCGLRGSCTTVTRTEQCVGIGKYMYLDRWIDL